MKRFWFEFDLEKYNNPPIGVKLGCGISANSYNECMQILKYKVFKNKPMPLILKCIEDVDITTLDANHVLPNMGLVTELGVWFPLGY